MEVSGAADTYCLKEEYKKFCPMLCIHLLAAGLARPHMINIQSTLLTAPDMCKNISLAILGLYGSNVNSNTISTQYIYIYIYIYIYSLQYRDARRAEEINKMEQQ